MVIIVLAIVVRFSYRQAWEWYGSWIVWMVSQAVFSVCCAFEMFSIWGWLYKCVGFDEFAALLKEIKFPWCSFSCHSVMRIYLDMYISFAVQRFQIPEIWNALHFPHVLNLSHVNAVFILCITIVIEPCRFEMTVKVSPNFCLASWLHSDDFCD